MGKIKKAYRSHTPEQAMAHLAEELFEAGAAAAKSLRFGIFSVNPELPADEQETNLAWLRREMADVIRAYCRLDEMLAAQKFIAPGHLTDDIFDALAEPGGDPVHDQ